VNPKAGTTNEEKLNQEPRRKFTCLTIEKAHPKNGQLNPLMGLNKRCRQDACVPFQLHFTENIEEPVFSSLLDILLGQWSRFFCR